MSRPSLSNHSQERQVARFYDRWIGAHNLYGSIGRVIFGISGDFYTRPFIRAAGLTAEDRVLEIGCGPAMILLTTHQQVKARTSYIGVDLSSVMIQTARQNINRLEMSKQVEVLIGSVALPLTSAQFTVVLLSHLIKYLTDEQLELCFSECARVLKPGGRLVLWEFAPLELSVLSRLVVAGAGAKKLRDKGELEAALTRAGFGPPRQFDLESPWLGWSNLALVAPLAPTNPPTDPR